MVQLSWNEKQTYRLNSRAQMWPSGLTLAMTLTLNFHKVKYRICYISAKTDQIASKWKANTSIELQASNVTNGFELDHNLDLWILKVKCDLDLWPHRWPWPWIFMVKFWNSCVSEWEGWLTLHKGGGSRSFMTMIMTIWWPRSGVWIYQVVTGVTSVVGVPSTHLVYVQDHLWCSANESDSYHCVRLHYILHDWWVQGLAHWGQDKMADFSRTTFSDAFSWMKMFEFRLRFHWSLFLRVQLTTSQH